MSGKTATEKEQKKIEALNTRSILTQERWLIEQEVLKELLKTSFFCWS